MQPINCLISNIPQALLVDIVCRIAEENHCVKVVDRIADSAELPAIMQSRAIDVLIIGMDEFAIPQVCEDLLKQFSDLLVVGLINDGRKAAVYINDIRGQEISDIIRVLDRRSTK